MVEWWMWALVYDDDDDDLTVFMARQRCGRLMDTGLRLEREEGSGGWWYALAGSGDVVFTTWKSSFYIL
jgi:hypothetical protein